MNWYDSVYGEKSLYYISDDNTVECLINEQQYWYFCDDPFVFEDCKLFLIDGRHGFHSVIGIKNNSPVIVGMPEDLFCFWIAQDPETGIVTTAGIDEEVAHVLEYDSSSMSFVDTGKTVPNN